MSFTSRLKKAAQNIPAMMDLYEAHTISNSKEQTINLYKKSTEKLLANGITCEHEAVQTIKDAKNLVSATGAAIFWGTIAAVAL